MDYNELKFSDEARAKLLNGIKTVAKAVKATIGPRGRLILVEKRGGAQTVLTKDGFSVAKAIGTLKDKYENLGATLAKQVSSAVVNQIGDGTSASILMTEALAFEGNKLITAGYDPMSIQRGISIAADKVIEEIKALSKPISNNEEMKQCALISANMDKSIADHICDAVITAGVSGTINLEEGKGLLETQVKKASGFEFDRGYLHQYFINDEEKQRVVMEDAYVWLVDGSIGSNTDMGHMMPMLDYCHKNGKQLVIIATDVSGEVLATLVLNAARKTIKVVAIKAPGYGDRRRELLQDMAVLTGATLRDPATGEPLLEETAIEELGIAKSITVYGNRTVMVGADGREEQIEAHIQRIRAQINEDTDKYSKEMTERRLAKLVGGVVNIIIGGTSELEVREKRDRYEDSLAAVKSAILGGLVGGGGSVYIRVRNKLLKDKFTTGNPEEDAGINLVLKCLTAPITQIIENAGSSAAMSAGVAINAIEADTTNTIGYDAGKNALCNLFEAGIVDPTLVCVAVIKHSTAMVGHILTVEGIITTVSDETQQAHPGQRMVM